MKKIVYVLMIVLMIWQGCTYETLPSPDSCETNGVVLDSVIIENTLCGADDGRIEVVASGGTGSYQYSLDGGALQSSPIFENLSAAGYTVTVVDNECSQSQEV